MAPLKIMIPVMLAAMATGVIVDRSLTKTRTITILQASGSLESRIFAIQGRIYPQGDNRFLFVDSTGQIELETCPVWYKRVIVSEGEQAIVTGERVIDHPKLEKSLFVMAVFSIDGSRSGVTTIRDQLGKPPWALNLSPSAESVHPLGLVENL